MVARRSPCVSFSLIRVKAWTNRASHGQWNTVARQGNRYFVGGYTGGFLLEWDPSATWVDTDPDLADTNPRFLADSAPSINRPHALLAHPNGRHLILGGTPGYGLTGGGILVWDRLEQKQVLLEHKDWLPNHSVMSLVALDETRAFGGSTVAPGTGGEARAQLAELFEFDLNTMQVTWHAPVLDGVTEYTNLTLSSEGLLYGIADKTRFFVYDIEARSILLEHATTDSLGESAYHQGPRLFITDPDTDTTFLLFHHCIAKICSAPDYHLQKVSESPVPIHCGGDLLGGRIYFGSGSHLYSCDTGEFS